MSLNHIADISKTFEKNRLHRGASSPVYVLELIKSIAILPDEEVLVIARVLGHHLTSVEDS